MIKRRFGSRTVLMAAVLLVPALVRAASSTAFIWIEGEAAVRTDVSAAHPWYAGAVNRAELSGSAFITNYGPKSGIAEYAVAIPAAGPYAFWVRANPVMRAFAYRIDGGAWSPVDMDRDARGRRNIAADGGIDLRFIAWAKAGDPVLAAGPHRIEFRFDDGPDHHGTLDCFVLAAGPFQPSGRMKPGEKTGWHDPGTWAFEPAADPLEPGAELDLRSLNERVAGESGYVRVSPATGGFVLGDGRPVRFWGVNSTVFRHADVEAIGRHARFLAKRGVNMVRAHVQLSVTPDGSLVTDVDAQAIDDVRRLVAGMKQAGIYVTISPYWAAAQRRVPASWGVRAPVEQDAQGLLFFDEKLQAGYRAWWRRLLAPVNPYTGIPLSRDPAVAILQLQNEDSLLFWTVGNLKGAALRSLEFAYAEFLRTKYGRAAGPAELLNIWELTQEAAGDKARRLADQTEFLARTMHGFNERTANYLREELRCEALINAGNWRTADQSRLLDAERWSYTAGDVIAVNRYYSPVHVNPAHPDRAGWTVEAGDLFMDDSALLDPRELPVNARYVKGFPYIISESTWTAPMSHTAEAPFLVAAYGSLGGLDGYDWFATDAPEYSSPGEKFPFADPAVLGGFPAAALAYRRGDIARSLPVIHEERPLADVWNRMPPVLAEEQGFDPNRDAGDRAALTRTGTAHPLAFLAGRVEAVYDGDPANTTRMDLAKLIDDEAGRITSTTGELDLDHRRGIATVNAPKVQGAAGFLAKRPAINLADVRIASMNVYAVIMVISLDGAPLAASGKVLIQATTTARAFGFRTEPKKFPGPKGAGEYDGFRIVSPGGPPWNVVNTDATVTVRNHHLTEAVRLDSNGYAAGSVPVVAGQNGLTLTLPPDALYVILR